MNVDCVLTNSTKGPARLVNITQVYCERYFTCQSVTNMAYYNVTCPGTRNIHHYSQDITDTWVCTMYSDGCVYTYSFTDNWTNTWTEPLGCAMPGGRACCGNGDLLIGEGHNSQPGPPPPLPPNPFR